MDRKKLVAAMQAKRFYGETDRAIRETLGIPESTYFYWKEKMRSLGPLSVVNKKKPGPRPGVAIGPAVRKSVLYYRDRYVWGPEKIAGHLRLRKNVGISHMQVYKLLKETGRNKPIGKPRNFWGKTRYVRKHVLSLIHADWKDVGSRPMLTLLDDHSRFILGSKRFDHATGENSVGLLEEAVEAYGRPEQVITDHGTQFWCNRSDGTSEFTRFCKSMGIKQILCSVRHPQANGKLENFHGQYDREIGNFSCHGAYIRYWNYKRPHSSLGYLYPSEVFFRDLKSGSN